MINFKINQYTSHLIFLFFLINPLIGGEYHVDKSKSNLVKFISDAPIEDFEGVTDKIDGYIYWEEDDLTKNSTLYFEVDLNSIDTGIGLRNRHMRENYLHTDKFPTTNYTGKIINVEQLSDDTLKVTLNGQIFIHGVEKPLTVTGKMHKDSETVFHITTNFIVALTEFDIEVPSLMFFKIDENMNLVLDFFCEKN